MRDFQLELGLTLKRLKQKDCNLNRQRKERGVEEGSLGEERGVERREKKMAKKRGGERRVE